jgi:hypothetical protein
MVIDSTKWRKTNIGFLVQTVHFYTMLICFVVVDGLQSEIPVCCASGKAMKNRFHCERIHSRTFQPWLDSDKQNTEWKMWLAREWASNMGQNEAHFIRFICLCLVLVIFFGWRCVPTSPESFASQNRKSWLSSSFLGGERAHYPANDAGDRRRDWRRWKRGLFDLIKIANRINRISSIERSNDIIRAFLCPRRDWHFGPDLRPVVQSHLLDDTECCFNGATQSLQSCSEVWEIRTEPF